MNHAILIIGYSMSESEPMLGAVDFALRKLKGKTASSVETLQDRAILVSVESQPEQIERLERLGLRIITFDPLDPSFTGFDQLWRQVSLRKFRPTSPDPPRITNSFDAMPKPEWMK